MSVARRTVSIMQACDEVGVSRRTIYNWIAAGKLEWMRTAGGSIRIFADTLWRADANRSMPRRSLGNHPQGKAHAALP